MSSPPGEVGGVGAPVSALRGGQVEYSEGRDGHHGGGDENRGSGMSATVTTRWQLVEVLRAARRRRALAELDYRRAVVDVIESGLEVSEVAARLQVPEAALEGVWVRCAGVSETREGFSGASPLEIVQRYDVGMLSAEQVVRELSAWDYDRMRETEDIARLRGEAGAEYGSSDDEAGPGAEGPAEEVGAAVPGDEENRAWATSGGAPAGLSSEMRSDPSREPVMGAAAADDHRWSLWLSPGAVDQVRTEEGGHSDRDSDRDSARHSAHNSDRGVDREVDAVAGGVSRWRPDPQGMLVNPDGEWAQVEDALQSGLLPVPLYVRVQLVVNPAMVLPEDGVDAGHSEDAGSQR